MNWQQEVSKISEHSDTAARVVKWMTPGIGVKRYFAVLGLCIVAMIISFVYFVWTGPGRPFVAQGIAHFDTTMLQVPVTMWKMSFGIFLLSGGIGAWSIFKLNRYFLQLSGISPEQAAEQAYSKHTLSRGQKIVALGGGTGLSNLLSGLKKYTSNITAVVAVTDDGGSSGTLRRDLQMIAPGDLTDCLAALSDSPVLARLLLHRFQRGEGISGHTFGNLMLATLSEDRGDFRDVVQDLNQLLNIRGRVYPATTDSTVLVAELSDGTRIKGESHLAQSRAGRAIKKMSLEPEQVHILPEVVDAIYNADAIVIGPGSLFTSLIPTFLVPEIKDALVRTSADVIYIANIMSEAGETDDLDLQGHVDMLVQHLGRYPDVVLANQGYIQPEVLLRYEHSGAKRLVGVHSKQLKNVVYYAPIVDSAKAQHDPHLLAAELVTVIGRLKKGNLRAEG